MKHIKSKLTSLKINHWAEILFILTIAFALLLRIIYLDRIPAGITNDELNFILNAKAVFLTGKDVAQVWNPLSLTTITGEFPRAELPYLIMAPFIGLMNFSLFNARLPYAIVGTGIILLTALISWKLFDKKIALLVAIMGAINPWSILFSRTAYEAPLAVFFFLLAFYLLLSTKGWKILFALIPLFLGFYCYMGTKLIFIPMTAIFIFYSWKAVQNKKQTIPYVTLFAICVIIVISFLFRYNHSAAQTRGNNELYTPRSSNVSAKVDIFRKLAIDTPVASLYSNKITVYLGGAIEKYFKAFSPTLLFTNGDGDIHQSLFYHGNFYYIDGLFIIIGLMYVVTRYKSKSMLLISLILIAPLPSVASNASLAYSLRSSLLFPLLITVAGIGVYAVITSTLFQKYRIVLSVLIIGSYVILMSNFLNLYFLRYPIYNAEGSNFSAMILARFMFHESANKNVVVITNGPEDLLTQYLFHNNLYNTSTKNQIAALYRQLHAGAHSIGIGNVTIENCPKEPTTLSNGTVIFDANINCERVTIQQRSVKKNEMYIAGLDDGRRIYKFYNAQYCANEMLEAYPHNITLSDLKIEKLTDTKFCTKFISRELEGN